MATKKVKKFGRGGDILTGIGAGLAGYGIYKALTKGKDDESKPKLKVPDEGIDWLGKPKTNKKNDSAEAETKVEDKVEAKTDSGRNSDLSPVEQHAAITKRSSVEPSDNTPVSTNDKKPRKVGKKDDKNKTTTNNVSPNANTSSDKGPKSRPYPLNSVPNENRKSKSYPSSDATAAAKKAARDKENEKKDKGYAYPELRRTVRETFPYLSSMTDPRGTPTMRAQNADPKRAYLHEMAEKGKEREKEQKAKKEAEAEKRRRNRPSSEEMMTQSLGGGFKRGGAVKKYASGGSVKTAKPTMRSASSRADGIAIRGKTRA